MSISCLFDFIEGAFLMCISCLFVLERVGFYVYSKFVLLEKLLFLCMFHVCAFREGAFYVYFVCVIREGVFLRIFQMVCSLPAQSVQRTASVPQ